MKVSKKKANEIIKKILGYVPKEMSDNEFEFEFYSGMIKVSIFKCIEKYHYSREYKYFDLYDKEHNNFINYNGPTITAQIYIRNVAKEIIKLKADNLQTISFEYNEEIEENNIEFE